MSVVILQLAIQLSIASITVTETNKLSERMVEATITSELSNYFKMKIRIQWSD
jgi:hypothetical protein